MEFIETTIKGAYVIEIKPVTDHRGFFARSFCSNEFSKFGLKNDITQCNISFNEKRGTVRGMHYQAHPHEEAKLVNCTKGAIYDVIVDLRPVSSTYCKWFGIELNEKDRKMLYVPEGVAHGFQTLEEDTVVFYTMFEFYYPQCARGVRWDDRAFGIKWPLPVELISGNDLIYPYFKK